MESWDIRALDVEARRPKILRSDEETRVIAIHLLAGEELQEHQVHERAFLFVSEGEVEISQGENAVVGRTGFLAHFDPAERHRVRAVTDAKLVLLLAPWPGVGHPSRRS